jgi:hypothetical protein
MKNRVVNLTISEKKFKEIYENELKMLNKKEYTLFEDANFNIDLSTEYNKFKNSNFYDFFIQENDILIKRKLIQSFFYENLIISLIESYRLIEENNSISSYKYAIIENTLEILFEEYMKILNLNKFVELFEDDSGSNFFKDSILPIIKKVTINIKNFSISFLLFLLVFFSFLYFLLGYTQLKSITYLMDLLKNLYNFEIKNPQIFNLIKDEIKNNITERLIKSKMNLTFDDIINSCWQKLYDKYLKVSDIDKTFLDKISLFIDKYTKKKLTYNLLKDPLFNYIALNVPVLVRQEKYRKFVEEWNYCIFNTIIELTSAIAVASFEIDNVSYDLIKNLVSSKNDPLRVISSFRKFYNINSNRINKAEKTFLESSLALLEIKVLIDKILLKHKDKLTYQIVTKYESLNKEINQRIAEIEESYRRIKEFNDQKLKKYEENLRQNNEKKLNGNKPIKPKKENLFDL